MNEINLKDIKGKYLCKDGLASLITNDGSKDGLVRLNKRPFCRIEKLMDFIKVGQCKILTLEEFNSQNEYVDLNKKVGMNLEEIKAAIVAGKTVRWKNNSYEVRKTVKGEFVIGCTFNNHCIGLTWTDGVTLNGNEKDFYIE